MKYKLRVGLSDHTNSTVIPFMAYTIDANYIEKHFTLDKSLVDLIIRQVLMKLNLRKSFTV